MVVHPAITDLAAAYRQLAEATGAPDPRAANAAHDQMHLVYKVLRQTEEGRRAILDLTADGSPNVRGWAAAHSLAWWPEVARRTLEALVASDGLCAFSAKMTLREFDAGRLSFDY